MKQLSIFIFVILVGVVIFNFIERSRFPFVYKMCDVVNERDCEVLAKFKSRFQCDLWNEMSGWACDKSDKQKIVCKADTKNLEFHCDEQ